LPSGQSVYTWSVEPLRPLSESPDQPSGDSNVPTCLVSDFQIVINIIERKIIPSLAVAKWYGEDTDQGNGDLAVIVNDNHLQNEKLTNKKKYYVRT
jgi:hypothetical protein